VLGFAPPQPAMDDVAKHAAKIREKLGVNTVVMHPTTFAAAADANGTAAVAGPYTERPKITTGAGDHFNAGFCFGRISGGTLETSLQIGVATSGFYVRNAKSPTQNDLKKFLKAL
jgi:sugar/nucleoside kinase (ribokinase family)